MDARSKEPTTTATVKPHGGVPTLFLGSAPVSALAYVGDVPEFCRDMGDAGFRFSSFVTRAHYAFYPDHPDPAARAARLREHDEKVARIVAAWPDAHFIVRVQLEAPGWWVRRYPGEAARHATGDGCYPLLHAGPQHGIPSWASAVWREQTLAALRGYIEHVEVLPFGQRFVGYHLASGTSAEWMAFGSNAGLLVDYSEPTKLAFRRWLMERYGGRVERFRAAWGLAGVSFETAAIPSPASRIAFDGQWLLDPQHHRQTIDYWHFFSDLTAETIRHLARGVKQITDGRALVGVFYGYVLQLCNEHRQQNGGHMAVRRILDCPDVDFVASPSHYGNRRLGTGYVSFMSVTESVKLHGKLWYNENDFMSPLGEMGTHDSGADTVDKYVEVQKACYAAVACGGVSQWLLGFNEGWYHDPQLVRLFRRQHEIDAEALAWDRTSTSEIAIIVDDASQLYQPVANLLPEIRRDSVSKLLIYDLPPRVGRCGCSVDWLLLDDLDRIRPYKLYVVLNAFALNEQRRSLVKWRLCRNGATVLWMYAPGAIGETLDVAGVRGLVGMNADMSREAVAVRLTFEQVDDPLLQRTMAGVTHMGDQTVVAPRFWIDDPRATVLARSTCDGRPVLGVRRFDDWTSVYLSSPVTLDERFIRELARQAGVHVFYDGPDATYIGPGLIGIHAQVAGRKRLTLAHKATVRDLYADRIIARGTDLIELDLRQYETRLLRFER